MTNPERGSAAPPKPPENWIEIRRGFGSIDLETELERGEFVTASGLEDGGYIVWREVGNAG